MWKCGNGSQRNWSRAKIDIHSLFTPFSLQVSSKTRIDVAAIFQPWLVCFTSCFPRWRSVKIWPCALHHGAQCVSTQWPMCFGQSSCEFEGLGGHSDGTGVGIANVFGGLKVRVETPWNQELITINSWFNCFPVWVHWGRNTLNTGYHVTTGVFVRKDWFIC